MTQLLETIFAELGIIQYLDVFLEQGFDTWETILDITESDLDALGVKLGHRRKLQRRIANFRGIASDASLVSPTQSTAEDLKPQDYVKPEPPTVDSCREVVSLVITKRKYRRHPKPDENAPERPPSAYVLFSNKMREELKGRNLTFTEIAKLVGENWQSLSPAEKEPFESRAQAIKDKYLSDLAEYKKTPEYMEYQSYLQEFKAKHGSPSQDKDASKRVRLSESRTHGRGSPSATPTRTMTSRSGSGTESRRGSEPPPGRQRVSSIASMSESQSSASLAASAPVASPEEPLLSPVVSNPEQHSFDRSPTFDPDARDQSSVHWPGRPGQEEQDREQLSMHQNLPSLSDMFSGQMLRGGMHSASEPNGFCYSAAHLVGTQGHTLHNGSGDAAQTMPNGLPYMGKSPSHQSFGHHRPQLDGTLSIHALLASRPEPTLHSNPPSHQHHNAYHMDQQPRLPHQLPNGAASLPMMNGHHQLHSAPPPSHHHHPMNAHHNSQPFPTKSRPATSPVELPRQGKQSAIFDGMNALLKAGEIVDRRTQ
ncbi:hypothetical protein N657DRAFT_652373 [Parathielavia appendiculata]|uniref:HMG box domain-containing protein n=1 Tax=Parathielavia appendiculata TaxID=2587402 RepID=A0AAN6U9S9_9PEZI|nr:hypothetical protein N657DRAFT_652373 [Parathielavia appendiculata]